MKQKLSKAAKQASLRLIKEMRKNDKSLKVVHPSRATSAAKKIAASKLVPPSKSKSRKGNKKAASQKRKELATAPLRQLEYPGRFFVKLNLDKKTQPIIPFMNDFRAGVRMSGITDVLLMTCDSVTPKTHDGLGIFVNSKKSVEDVAKMLREIGLKFVNVKHFQPSVMIPKLLQAQK